MSSFLEKFQSDAVLRRVLDSTREYAIFALDRDGNVATWNDGARRIKGYEAEEIVGKHFGVLYTPEDQAEGRPERNLELARKNGEFREEHVRMRKDGSRFEADVDISAIEDETGELAGFLKVVHDVSERRRLEAELRESRDALEGRVTERTAELRRANMDLDAFCHSVAHDLRAPIRAIVSKCRIVDADFHEHLPPSALDHLDGLVATAMRMAALVDDLLEFARAGQKPVARESVDLTLLARQLAADLLPSCHGGEASFVVEDGLTAEADPQLVEMVLRNLLENACKYSERGLRVVVGKADADGETAFYVRDDGLGFEAARADELFQPFIRLHPEGAAKGTGIGLANVRRIVERHGGRAWAESEPGGGATFWFTLGQP